MSQQAFYLRITLLGVAAGLLTGAAGLGANAAMVMMGGMVPTFLGAEPTGFAARFQHAADRLRIGSGTARDDLAGRSADIGTVEVETDALSKFRNAAFTDAGIGTRQACLGAGETFLDADEQRLANAALHMRMGTEHLLNQH
jgi:hypothetical protein